MRSFIKPMSFLICLFLLLGVGCKNKPIETASFSGVVVQVNEGNIIVQPFEEEDILKTANQISVSINIDIDNEAELPKLHIGDNVSITWSGMIRETGPATLETVHAISVIEK